MDHQVLRWLDGEGWLVFSGGNDALSTIRSAALARMEAEGDVVYLGVDDSAADELIDDMGELGAPAGYLVNVLTEDDDTIRSYLGDAGLIVVPDALPPAEWKSVLSGAAIAGIQHAYEHGAVVLIEGAAASVFGQLFVVVNQGTEGFDWLNGAFLVTGVSSISEAPLAREILAAEAASIAVGIGVGSGLAVGPHGQVETWGNRQVTIALGANHTT